MGEVKNMGTIPERLYRNQLVTISDLDSFKEELLLALAAQIKEHLVKPGKRWLKSFEVRKLLNVSNGTLMTLRTEGTLPFSRIGSIMYYDMEDIDRLLMQNKRGNARIYGLSKKK